MKRLLTIILASCLATAGFAQQPISNGYYRVKNQGTERYIKVIDNYGHLDKVSQTADMAALKTIKGFDKVVSDPSSIIYFQQKEGNAYDLKVQGTSLSDIIPLYLYIWDNCDGTYKAYGKATSAGVTITKYLSDEVSRKSEGVVLATGPSATDSTNPNWYFLPVSTQGDNYFGVAPDVFADGVGYKAFYASFPFSFVSSGTKAYYVTKVDKKHAIAVYDEVNGAVPASSPIIVKCAASDAAQNKLEILATSPASLTGNLLRGAYFCNPAFNSETGEKTPHHNVVDYDASTMRVLGKTSDGSLGMVTANLQYIPANTSYLVVDSDAPAQLKLMSKEEYAAYKEVTVTANSYTRAYGDENPVFEYTSSETLTGTPQLTCEATATSPVGTYPITVSQGTVTGCQVVGVAGVLTITAAPLTVTANDAQRVEGEENPALTVTYSGFKNGETEAVLTKKAVATTTADKNSVPGTYPIKASGAEASNYAISYIDGTLTVLEGTVTVTAKSYTRVYGEANPVFEYTSEGVTLKGGQPELSCEATANSPVGTYPIVVSKGTITNSDDKVTFVNGTLTITAATLTIGVESATKVYGDENPEFAVTYQGFKNEDTEAVLTVKPTVTTTATKESGVGEYDLKVQGAEAQNYTIIYTDGKLSVTPAVLTVTAQDATRLEGDENPEFQLVYEGFKNADTEEVLTRKPVATTTATVDSPVGEYDIVVTGGEAQNYTFEYVNGKLTVTERPQEGISAVVLARGVDVYNVYGVKIRTNVTTLEGLPKGIYVINGQKVMVR